MDPHTQRQIYGCSSFVNGCRFTNYTVLQRHLTGSQTQDKDMYVLLNVTEVVCLKNVCTVFSLLELTRRGPALPQNSLNS